VKGKIPITKQYQEFTNALSNCESNISDIQVSIVALAEDDYDRPSMLKQKWKPKRNYGLVFLSILVGLSAFAIDVAMDAFVFHEGTFLNALLVSSFREQASRIQLFLAFALSSAFVSRGLTASRRAEERLSALNICGRNLNRARDLNEVYELTLAAMELTLGFEYAAFMLVEDRKLAVVRQRGFGAQSPLDLPLDGTKGGVTVKAAVQRRAIIVSDVAKDPDYVRPSSFFPPVRSEIAVPLIVEDKVLGVLNAESKKVKAFDANDVVLLQILASHAATAIANLEAQEQIRSHAGQLEAKVKQKTGELTAAQDSLVKAQRFAAIGELAGMVGHDLRNPLTSIAGATYYLRKKYGPEIDEKGNGMFEIIERDIQYSNKIINDLLDYSRDIRLELVETDPKSILREALSTVSVPSSIKVADRTKKRPRLRVDPAKIQRVFANIIKNSIDAMPSGGQLTVSSVQKGNSVVISISDTGVGISKEDLGKIWTPLFTTKAKGMGFGLSICKRIVDAHQGSVLVESSVGKGTKFSVSLPLESVPGGDDGISFEIPAALETKRA
jgi:signal transduction histidine kinase